MSIENEIAGLTQSTTDLLEAVNTKKATLDTAVSNAETAVVDATSQVSLAAAEKVGAQTARDTAETFKDQAYTYSQSAASAVAYQDLTAIAQTKVDSARDVFVYDTTKDSDGGAWRQRTQGTSWYNETLNTATRGSRKEFPAVAVIVAETNKVTIYDGDDPSMPMWMDIPRHGNTVSNDAWYGRTDLKTTCVSALNGQIWIGATAGNASIRAVSFIDDRLFKYALEVNNSGLSSSNVSERQGAIVETHTLPTIVDSYVNDVAMTVLPNAPIDPATGLPIPTIAVATDGGVSVIKDDGTVVDITVEGNYSYVTTCIFYGERLAFVLSYQNIADDTYYHIVDIPSADITIQRLTPVSALNGEFYRSKAAIPPLPITPSFAANLENTEITEKAIGSDYGFMPFDRLPENQEQGSIAYITSDYNTGWMNGDIKLATLSDTDDTDLVDSELVTNGTFDSDTSGWVLVSPATHTVTSGEYVLTTTGNGQGSSQSFPTVVGKTYVVSADVRTGTASSTFLVATYSANAFSGSYGYASTSSSTTSTLNVTFTANSATSWVYLRGGSAGTHIYDNISVRLAEADRSVNNNGLQVFGTVQKNPVATGADLVGYSGFTSSNFLMQPYNSDLDFGTGDFCVMGWVNNTTSFSKHFFTISNSQGTNWGTNGYITIKYNADFPRVEYLFSGGIVTGSQLNDDTWHHLCLLRKDGVVYAYLDGKIAGSQSNTNNLGTTTTDSKFYMGVSVYNGNIASNPSTKQALWRVSKTAPTAEQIAKIYRDEKVLFQENAQATLYGTSDAVTALAYDDTTELLHVGTSSGRSVFQGLQRVDNTTDAVGTAISASNNLVVEE